MKDLVPAEVDVLVLLSRNFIRVCVVDIVELATFISVNFDIFRQKRIQTQHRVLAIPDDLCVALPQRSRWVISVSQKTKDVISGLGWRYRILYSG